MGLQLSETPESLSKNWCFTVTGASVFKRMILEEWEEKEDLHHYYFKKRTLRSNLGETRIWLNTMF